jgi:hypothetical protein
MTPSQSAASGIPSGPSTARETGTGSTPRSSTGSGADADRPWPSVSFSFFAACPWITAPRPSPGAGGRLLPQARALRDRLLGPRTGDLHHGGPGSDHRRLRPHRLGRPGLLRLVLPPQHVAGDDLPAHRATDRGPGQPAPPAGRGGPSRPPRSCARPRNGRPSPSSRS